MKSLYFSLILTLLIFSNSNAQTQLSADGPGNTYELITSVLAPGQNPIETPDCSHTSFGRHIDEVWDPILGEFVFRFHIHVSPDDDRCINFDRQRNEIKTYNQSADSLQGIIGETVVYKWKFKLAADFQASSNFTHLHQIKAVGGPEAVMPKITLTARSGNPEYLELQYAKNTNQIDIAVVHLDSLRGIWVEVEETITYGEIGTGAYEISITKVSDGSSLLYFQNDSNVRMWNTDAEFMRPKWGIYRSLNSSSELQDEEVLFADFYIDELCSIDPIFTASAIPASCVNGLVDLNSAFIRINSISIGDRFGYSTGNTYTGPDYALATQASGLSYPIILEDNIANPSTPLVYTVRVYNGENECYKDQVITLFGGVFPDADNDGVCNSHDVCSGGPDPGQVCDDGDANTTGDIVDGNCNCSGTFSGCLDEIILNPGWNLVSSNCEPANLDISAVFSNISNNVVEVKDLENSFVPLFNYNNIGNWDVTSGYLVKVIQQDTLVISGSVIDASTTPIFLETGWNLLAYYLDVNANPTDVFAPIANEVIQIKDLDGSYELMNATGNLGPMMPTEGFLIYMSAPATLIYEP